MRLQQRLRDNGHDAYFLILQGWYPRDRDLLHAVVGIKDLEGDYIWLDPTNGRCEYGNPKWRMIYAVDGKGHVIDCRTQK